MLTTTVVEAEGVRVTEIAWMGNVESQFGEWFELFNDSSEDINLAGWKLYEGGGDQLVFTMTKTILANGYLVVERTTGSSPDPVPGIDDESGPFGGSGFSNSGENLVLKDNNDATIQTLNFSSGWPAGDTETKKTMQWDGSKWITATATPKAATISGGGETPTTPTISASTSYVTPKIEPKVQLFIPKTVYSTVSTEYNARTFLEYGEAWTGVFLWNMGDGMTYKSNSPQVIKHTYAYPGTYTISFGYYKYPYDKVPSLTNSFEKVVISPKIIFNLIKDKGFQFTNSDTVPVDISGWVIVLSDRTVELPPMTVIASKQTVLMPFSVFGLDSTHTVATLETPERTKLGVEDEIQVLGAQSGPVTTRRTPFFNRQEIYDSSPASVADVFETTSSDEAVPTQKNHLKVIVFGGVLLLVITLFILIERARAKEQD